MEQQTWNTASSRVYPNQYSNLKGISSTEAAHVHKSGVSPFTDTGKHTLVQSCLRHCHKISYFKHLMDNVLLSSTQFHL